MYASITWRVPVFEACNKYVIVQAVTLKLLNFEKSIFYGLFLFILIFFFKCEIGYTGLGKKFTSILMIKVFDQTGYHSFDYTCCSYVLSYNKHFC